MRPPGCRSLERRIPVLRQVLRSMIDGSDGADGLGPVSIARFRRSVEHRRPMEAPTRAWSNGLGR